MALRYISSNATVERMVLAPPYLCTHCTALHGMGDAAILVAMTLGSSEKCNALHALPTLQHMVNYHLAQTSSAMQYVHDVY